MGSSIKPFDIQQTQTIPAWMRGFTPMLKQLGYTGPVSREISMGGGVDESGRELTGEGLAPEAMAWLQDQGYTINDIYDSKSKSRFLQAVDPDGQPVGQWKYQSRGLTPLQAAAAVWGLGYGVGNLASGLGAASAAPAASSPYSLAGSGASLGSSAVAASPYALTGAQLGNTAGAIASGLTGTGSGLGISNLANALATSGIGAGIGSSLPAVGESFLGAGASSGGVGSLLDAASGIGTLPADPFGGAAVPAIAPETLSTAGLEPLSLTPFVKGSELTGAGASLWDKAKDLIIGKAGIGSLLPDNATDWAKLLTTIGGGYAAYKGAKQPQLQGYGGSINAKVPTQTIEQSRYGPISRVGFAAGGIAGLPRYFDSPHDGMGDGIAASIDGQKSAALSGGEFVIPADVVSHLGNGNSQAGAQQLFAMMDRVRQERTGTRQQGRQIDPLRMMPR